MSTMLTLGNGLTPLSLTLLLAIICLSNTVVPVVNRLSSNVRGNS